MPHHTTPLKRALLRSLFWLALLLCAEGVVAGEYLQLQEDLDGDGKPDTLHLTLSGEGDYQRYTLRIESHTLQGNYFAVDRDLPQLSLLRLDDSSRQKLILITSFGPSSCEYRILAYIHDKLISLLEHSAENCIAPIRFGNRTLQLASWQGFWSRPDNYRLTANGELLLLQPQHRYSVNIAGVANQLTAMHPDHCAKASIPSGEYVVIKEYDAGKKAYLIANRTDSCGWIDEERLSEAVLELPWAG